MRTRPADNARPTEETGPGLSRRRFLQGTGAGVAAVGAGGAALSGPAAAAAGTGGYAHSNGYFSVRGSYGKLTSLAVDPTGHGQYREPDTFGPVFLGYADIFTEELNPGVRWSRRGDLLRLTGVTVSGPAYSIGQDGDNKAAPELTAGHSLTQGSTVSTVAEIDIVLQGPRLQLSYTLVGAGNGAGAGPGTGTGIGIGTKTGTVAGVSDLGLTFTTPWRRDGYSVGYADGVLFDRFFTDNGQLMPAQQLKRRPSWGTNGLGPAHSITATGTGDYDISWRGAGIAVNGVSPIDPTSMSLQFTPSSGPPARSVHRRVTVEVRPTDRTLPPTFPVFEASDGDAAEALTTFLHERALSAPQAAGATNGADWKDWTGRMYDWTPGGFSSGEREAISAIKQDPDGYVWTWNPSDSRGWPFPDQSVWDTRHFVSNPMYVLGTWRYYSWTGDRAFLATMLPRVRKAIDYCLSTLRGSEGLLTEPGPDHAGLPGGIGSNYWDITPFGHLDAYTNAYFYGCLEPAAQLEDDAGDPARARLLRALAPTVRARYNEVFWDEPAGRYIECVDADGTRHDYGWPSSTWRRCPSTSPRSRRRSGSTPGSSTARPS